MKNSSAVQKCDLDKADEYKGYNRLFKELIKKPIKIFEEEIRRIKEETSKEYFKLFSECLIKAIQRTSLLFFEDKIIYRYALIEISENIDKNLSIVYSKRGENNDTLLENKKIDGKNKEQLELKVQDYKEEIREKNKRIAYLEDKLQSIQDKAYSSIDNIILPTLFKESDLPTVGFSHQESEEEKKEKEYLISLLVEAKIKKWIPNKSRKKGLNTPDNPIEFYNERYKPYKRIIWQAVLNAYDPNLMNSICNHINYLKKKKQKIEVRDIILPRPIKSKDQDLIDFISKNFQGDSFEILRMFRTIFNERVRLSRS